MKNGMKIIAAMAVIFWAANASADIIISSPMHLNDEYIVGIIDNTGPLAGGVSVEMAAAQKLLDLTQGQIDGKYMANADYDYIGILNGTGYKDNDGSELKISGYEYVMAKYDGQNAGYVLFYNPGGGDITIPQYPYDLWTTNHTKWAISHWTAFNATPVPEPATMLLFGTGLVGLAGIARRKVQ